jgi:hypothetical protein
MEPWRANDAHSGGLKAQNGALEGLPVVAVSFGTGTPFMRSRFWIRIEVIRIRHSK